MFLCCVYDKATNQFGNPFSVVSKGQAMRSFGDEVQSTSPDNSIARHPDDFELFYLGCYDTDDGSFDVSDRPERIAQGVDFKR